MTRAEPRAPPDPSARRPRTRRALLWALLIAIAIAGAGGLGAARSYVEQSPDSCTASCHRTLPASHAGAAHARIACQTCHDVTFGEGLRLFADRVRGATHVAAHGRVRATGCAGCHNASDVRWLKIAATSGHRAHADRPKVDCLSCHRGGGPAAADVCVGCHADARLHQSKDLPAARGPECLSCHNFRAEPAAGRPWLTVGACERCHSAAAHRPGGPADVVPAAVIRSQDLHGGVDCKLCHDPHRRFSGVAAEPPCASCHDIEIGIENHKLPKEHHECTSCHKMHAPLSDADKRCKQCHEQAREREGKPRSTALQHDACSSCHQPHSWVAAINGCVQCHARQAALVFGKSPAQHQRCINCHDVHGPPPTGAVCGTCHKDNAAKMRAAPVRHQECTSCHNPHAPLPELPQACIGCHADEVRELVSVGPAGHARAGCTGCHTLHGDPKANVTACARCHADKMALVRTAGPAPHRDCLSCHQPHRFSLRATALPCVRCHQQIANHAEIHTGRCTTCHSPHGPPAVTRARCLGCHRQIHLAPINQQHSKCDSCHVPHERKEAALERCRECHADKARIADLWPVNSAHRQACNSCHQQHDVQQKKACGECHAEEAQMVQGNPKHQCKGCHAPHQVPPATLVGWYGRCANCHESEAAESKQHTACNNCHKPHGFMPPKCVTCHAANIRKGLHTVQAHSQCGKCHETHSASLPGRAQCLACHKDKQNHQPGPAPCQSCHLFK
jgi:Cytochrome c3